MIKKTYSCKDKLIQISWWLFSSYGQCENFFLFHMVKKFNVKKHFGKTTSLKCPWNKDNFEIFWRIHLTYSESYDGKNQNKIGEITKWSDIFNIDHYCYNKMDNQMNTFWLNIIKTFTNNYLIFFNESKTRNMHFVEKTLNFDFNWRPTV